MRARRRHSLPLFILSLAQVAKPAAKKPAAKPAAKKPAKKSCEPGVASMASTAAPSPRRHANPRRRPAKKKPAAKAKSPARKKKK